MLLLGIAFCVFAALIEFAGISIVGSAFLVGAACIILGLVLGERLPSRT